MSQHEVGIILYTWLGDENDSPELSDFSPGIHYCTYEINSDGTYRIYNRAQNKTYDSLEDLENSFNVSIVAGWGLN